MSSIKETKLDVKIISTSNECVITAKADNNNNLDVDLVLEIKSVNGMTKEKAIEVVERLNKIIINLL